jgi:hypothetical protein
MCNMQGDFIEATDVQVRCWDLLLCSFLVVVVVVVYAVVVVSGGRERLSGIHKLLQPGMGR